MNLNNLLAESCSKMHEIALRNCGKDYVDEKEGCCWYHSVWQYLRALNCVSAPQWHDSFYRSAINAAIKDKTEVVVFISGTADYSMLHIITDQLTKTKIKAKIVILDKCATPLEICKWYAKKLLAADCNILPENQLNNFKSNIDIEYVQQDLLYYGIDEKFDIICTDAFLTRFESGLVKSVITNWASRLKPDGKIINTVRIHDATSPRNLVAGTHDIISFNDKVRTAYREYIKNESSFPLSEEEILFLANRYIIRMYSNDIGDRSAITKLFKDCGLRFNEKTNIIQVSGEISETNYMQIIAEL